MGDGGAWVGGDWVPIEECAKNFLCEGSVTSGHTHAARAKCVRCPRSRSRVSAAKADGSYDVVVIGAGCVGAAVARELSKTNASVLLLEAADDVTQGATKGNSGIVHSGYDDKPGSNRAKFCNKGCLMFPQLDRELHFGFQRNGSLVIAHNKEEEVILQRLLEQGKANGVKNISIISGAEAKKLEPNLNPHVTAALRALDAGNVIPYEYCIALAENAVDNGVELRLRREVTAIEETADGYVVTAAHWEDVGTNTSLSWLPAALLAVVLSVAATWFMWTDPSVRAGMQRNIITFASTFFAVILTAISRNRGGLFGRKSASAVHKYSPSKGTVFSGNAVTEKIRCGFIVNCAGTKSDKIASMVGDTSFEICERHGEYILLNKAQTCKVTHTIFPCPDPVKGKGVLVQTTLWGNLILGPTARDSKIKDPTTGKLLPNDEVEKESADSIFRYILSKCADLVPGFDAKQVIHTFSGARAKNTRGDWIIEPCAKSKRLIHAAGIDSPGLAGSPAIAVEVVRLLGLAGAPVNDVNCRGFNPIRAPIVMPKKGFKDALGRKIVMNKVPPAPGSVAPHENVVCKCEKVTEAEVIEACRRSLPIDNTQAVRRRTRAGMGHCQGEPCNYDCETRVAAIIAKELGISPSHVGRRPWPASSLMPKRWFGDAEKEHLASLS